MSTSSQVVVAFDGIAQHHSSTTAASTSAAEDEKSHAAAAQDSSNATRPRRDADNNAAGAQDKEKTEKVNQPTSPTKAPPPTVKKNPMKNRIYTSQISYPSPSGSGGRIFNSASGISGNSSRLSGANATMERERIRMEFYATYDVMTGIRIAATLGGFFAFVILLVMFKSRSHTNQALKDPKIVAVAAAVVLEEEERELQEKLDATGLTLYTDDINYEYRRQRLLSLGGFDPALIDSPRRYSYGYAGIRSKCPSNQNVSRPGSRRSSAEVQTISRYSYDYHPSSAGRDQYQQQDGDDDFIMVEREEQENEFQEIEFRSSCPPVLVPRANSYDSRRGSSITCCSTESSYLERRCSALTLGIYSIGANLVQPPTTPVDDQARPSGGELNMPLSSYFCPPSIATTASAGSASTRALRSNNSSRRFSGKSSRRSSFLRRSQHREDPTDISLTLAADSTDPLTSTTLKGTAPLASLSSFRISSIDQVEPEMRSLGSDSVFCEQYVDTDEEVAQFSSDSDEPFEGLPLAERARETVETNVFVETPTRAEDDVECRDIPLERVESAAKAVGSVSDEEQGEVEAKEESSVHVLPETAPSSLCHSPTGGGGGGGTREEINEANSCQGAQPGSSR